MSWRRNIVKCRPARRVIVWETGAFRPARKSLETALPPATISFRSLIGKWLTEWAEAIKK